MRFSITKLLVIGLASTEIAVASTWFSKAAYNKWHETELERWLSDHDIPYPAASDRKDLENLVKANWQKNVHDPIASAGGSASTHTSDSYENMKESIFDSWTESSLKAFLDYHNIPAPQPRTRDSYLKAARKNYDTIAKKFGDHAAYPSNWLYESWSDSDLKKYLDTHGIPAPQPTNRDKLIASVRRNARLANLNASKMAQQATSSVVSGASVASASGSSAVSGASASGSGAISGAGASVSSYVASGASDASAAASSATGSISDTVFDTWSDSSLKEFFDKHGIKVPQGSRRNEMIALARKHSTSLGGTATSVASSLSGSGASAFGAATSKAGDEAAKATDDASAKAEDAFDSVIDTWSDSRLKGFLDSRGVPVPQGGKRDELLAKVRLNKHKATTGWSAWTFDTWTTENLQKYLSANGKKARKNAGGSRDELMKQAQDAYASASKSGGSSYASVTSYLASATDAAKDSSFDTWSDSELKSYLDSYGARNYQGSTTNELRAMAKKQSSYFRYGTSTPSGTIYERLKGGAQWLLGQFKGGAAQGSATGQQYASEASKSAASATGSAKKEL